MELDGEELDFVFFVLESLFIILIFRSSDLLTKLSVDKNFVRLIFSFVDEKPTHSRFTILQLWITFAEDSQGVCE